MKARSSILRLGIFALTTAGLSLGPRNVSAEDLWVQVARTSLRSAPEHYAPTVASVAYGDRISSISESDGWIKAKTAGGKSGFVHVSAVTGKEVVLSGRRASSNVSSAADVVMAGKGFSKEIEEQYKRKGGGVRFDLVDQMERTGNASPKDVQQFVVSGRLKG